MSGSLTLMLPGNRREVVRTNPTMTLGAALAEVCSRAPRPLGDPDNFCLILNKKELDLSTPVRFAGLASGAKLDVVRKQNANKPAAAPGAPASVSTARSDGAGVPAAAAAAAVHPVQPVDAGAVVVAENAAPTAPSPLVDTAAKLAGRPVAVHSRQALQSATESSGEQRLPSGEDLPEEFYEMTPEDIMRLTKRKEEEVLMTRAMREAAVAKRASEFSRALIRVECADGLVLEAAFGPLEPCSALRSVVSACLHPSLASAFHLFTAPPKRKLADWDQSLYAAGFVPAARVHLGIDRPGHTGPALRPELLAVTDLLPPTRMTEQPAHGGGAQQHGAAVATGGVAADVAGGPPVPPREGVRSPEELRQTLAAGKKPKWMKL